MPPAPGRTGARSTRSRSSGSYPCAMAAAKRTRSRVWGSRPVLFRHHHIPFEGRTLDPIDQRATRVQAPAASGRAEHSTPLRFRRDAGTNPRSPRRDGSGRRARSRAGSRAGLPLHPARRSPAAVARASHRSGRGRGSLAHDPPVPPGRCRAGTGGGGHARRASERRSDPAAAAASSRIRRATLAAGGSGRSPGLYPRSPRAAPSGRCRTDPALCRARAAGPSSATWCW